VKILVLAHRLPFAPNRGDRIRLFHLCRLLRAAHQVHVVSLIHDADEWAHLAGMQQAGVAATGTRLALLRHVAALAALPGKRPLTHVLLDGANMAPILERECAWQPDVVLAYGTGMVRYALEGPLRATPCVLDMIDVDSEKWAQLAERASWPMSWIYRREADTLRAFERVAVQQVAATTVSSVRERELATRVLNGAVPVVVTNGVDVEHFAPPSPPAASSHLVFCGVFNYQPNEEAAIWLSSRVWPLVRSEVPAAVLQLVGMKPSRAVRALAQPGSIEVTGEVADVRPFLWNAAAAAAPLFVARGVQNKVLEALAAGVPCVVSPAVLDGLPEAVRGGCIEQANPDAFAAAVVRLLRLAPDERRALAARARIDECSWPSQLATFVTLLRDAAASPQLTQRRASGVAR
jgi:sugar transferase (PEP-CTERM/EpsH1 system associated)